MSASWGRRDHTVARSLVFLLLLLSAGLALGQDPPVEPSDERFPLNPTTRHNLTQLQMDWLAWLVACNEGDGEAASEVIANLQSHIRVVGMEHLPELSAAAAVRAIEFAEAGQTERASWALEAAERLAPGLPERAFAASRVAWISGDYLAAAGGYFGGLVRSIMAPQIRFVMLNNLILWLVTVITLAGLLLVGVLMISRGPALYFDLFRYFNRFLPALGAHFLCLVLLSWPLFLPTGVLWTAIYWSVLLWAYGGKLERILLIAIWLFVGSLPALLTEQGRRVGLALYAPVQSIESASRGALEGDLFSHLALLQSILPESVPLQHYSADIHRRLGQMEISRALYRGVLDEEPNDAAALNDLGIYYFEVSDFDTALDFFERAAETDPESAETQFNLGQTYSELYRFEESEASLFKARAIDSDSVDLWLKRGLVERVIAIDGGLERVDEVRSELLAQWQVTEEAPGWFGYLRRALSLPLVSIFVVIAVVVRLGTRRGRSARAVLTWWRPGAERLRRVLLAGVPEAEMGRAGRAAASLLLLVGLASLPLANQLGYGLPWLHARVPGLLPIVAAVGLVLFLGLRYLFHGRGEH